MLEPGVAAQLLLRKELTGPRSKWTGAVRLRTVSKGRRLTTLVAPSWN